MSARRVVALALVAVAAVSVAGCDPAAQKAACARRGGQMVGELHRVPRYKTDARGRVRLAGYTTEYRTRCVVEDAR